MEIEKIIYQTTREIYSVEDKMSIATIFLFCEKISNKLFAELLYTDNHENFISKINVEYSEFDVDFSIRLTDANVRNSFYKTLEKVKEQCDNDGYYKALYNGDEFAIVIDEIISFDMKKKFTIKQMQLNFEE